MIKWIAAAGAFVILVTASFATVLLWLDSGGGVEDWSCAVTEEYNPAAGGGMALNGGDCAVAVAGCRRQSQCTIHTMPNNKDFYILEGLNMSDPELQKRLK